MVTVIVEDKIDYKSAQDLMDNNASDGAWKGQFRDKFEERSEQIDQMQASLNEQAALGNIFAAQQAQVSQYILDPITGEVLETSDGFDSGLSVSAITSLIERGASDDEISAALDAALTSITGRIAGDKKNAKKYLAHLQELLHVLELSLKQAGRNVELQNTLRALQEKNSKLMQAGDITKIMEFLRNPQLREALTQSVQQSRQQVDFMRTARDMLRNLANQVRESGVSRDVALQNLQAASRDMLQEHLRDMMRQLKETYEQLRKEAVKETDPSKLEAMRKALTELTNQARELQRLSKLNADPNISLKQFEQSRMAAERLSRQTSDMLQSLRLSQGPQQAMITLAAQQQMSTQAMSARMEAQRAAEARINSAAQASPANARANLQAYESLLTRPSQQPDMAQQLVAKIGERAVIAERAATLEAANREVLNKDSANKDTSFAQRQDNVTQKQEQQQQRQEEKQEQLSQKQEQRQEQQAQKQETAQAEKADRAEKAKLETVKQENIKKVATERASTETVKAEKADPCAGCGGGKGCCGAPIVSKVDAPTVAAKASTAPAPVQVNSNTTAIIANNHQDFKEAVATAPQTVAAASFAAAFAASSAAAPSTAATATSATEPAQAQSAGLSA